MEADLLSFYPFLPPLRTFHALAEESIRTAQPRVWWLCRTQDGLVGRFLPQYLDESQQWPEGRVRQQQRLL